MNRHKSKFNTLSVITFLFLSIFCKGERKHLFFSELCEESTNPEVHLSVWESRGESAVTLSLSKDDYPTGLNCCVSVTSDKKLAVEINDINLPLRPGQSSCLDHLKIITTTDILSLCHPKSLLENQAEAAASNTLMASHFIDICFDSKQLYANNNNDDSSHYGFTLRFIAFSEEPNVNRCGKIFDGFLCHNTSICLPLSLKCDAEEDCFDGSDETHLHCRDVTTFADVEIDSPVVGLSLQGAITVGGISIIVCGVLVMCMWQCLVKFKPGVQNNANSSQNEINNVPMAIYTVPMTRVTSPALEIPTYASTSNANADRIIVTCTSRQQINGDLPPSYDTLFANNNNNNNNNNNKAT